MTENITTSLDIQNSSFNNQSSSSNNYSGQGAIAPEYLPKNQNSYEQFGVKNTGQLMRDTWRQETKDSTVMALGVVDESLRQIDSRYDTGRNILDMAIVGDKEGLTNQGVDKAQSTAESSLTEGLKKSLPSKMQKIWKFGEDGKEIGDGITQMNDAIKGVK